MTELTVSDPLYNPLEISIHKQIPTILTNETKTRTFIGLKVAEHSDLFLQKLVTVVDKTITKTAGGLGSDNNLFYIDPVFHVSLLSCSGDV